jgi:hypothetical protein
MEGLDGVFGDEEEDERKGIRGRYELQAEDVWGDVEVVGGGVAVDVDGPPRPRIPGGAFDVASEAARACCIHTSRAPWSTGQISTPAFVFVPTGGCEGGRDVAEEELDAAAAALAFSSQASLLLWSTGHVSGCLGSVDIAVFGG